MGLFSRKDRTPVVHPRRSRHIHVAAPETAVRTQLAAYDDLGGGGDPVPLGMASTDGWTTVAIEGALHPWAFHNLTLWLVDTPGATDCIATAGPADGHLGYWLVQDEHDSWLSGYDDDGTPLTVSVPTNEMVVGEALSHPAATRTQALAGRGVPPSLHAAAPPPDGSVHLEDPGRAMNPAMESTAKNRQRLDATNDIIF